MAIRTVRPANRLQQGVVSERPVEIHCLQDRCVETREQFRRNNNDLERVFGIPESIEKFLLRIPAAAIGCISVLSAIHRHDDVRDLKWQVLVKCLFIEKAAFPIKSNNLGAKTVRRHLFLEVLCDIGTHRLYAIWRL